MSEFHVEVARVQNVETHPDPGLDHLSVVTVLGKICIAGKLEDGQFRYNRNDLVVYVPVNAIIPLEFLEFQGFYWDNEKSRGLLKGSKRNRVGSVTRGSITSQGILLPLDIQEGIAVLHKPNGWLYNLQEGKYLEDNLGITEFKG